MLDTISQLESNVRGYVRLFPTVFDVARGSEIWDVEGKRYIDFFCGAGSLNYGHNNPRAKSALLDYISRDGIQHALDTATNAKIDFLRAFQTTILEPRNLEYRIQFTGPTGTNAVEAAIKLARRLKKRANIIAFSHAYHGHSLGSLALTANSYYHDEHYGSHNNVSHLPFDGYCQGVDSAVLLEKMLSDTSSGVSKPAAIILETIQGEGGVNVASTQWLKRVAELCKQHDVMLIVDDIQVGNGRTGQFFSFEAAGICPDIVCMSKSLGGGLPMSIVLLKPEHDAWEPGQHTGTFRGNNLAFVAATALIELWQDNALTDHIQDLEKIVTNRLARFARCQRKDWGIRGRGLIQALDLRDGELCGRVIRHAFQSGLLIEASGANDEVLKIMPALTTPTKTLHEGLDILENSIHTCVNGLLSGQELPVLALENLIATDTGTSGAMC